MTAIEKYSGIQPVRQFSRNISSEIRKYLIEIRISNKKFPVSNITFSHLKFNISKFWESNETFLISVEILRLSNGNFELKFYEN